MKGKDTMRKWAVKTEPFVLLTNFPSSVMLMQFKFQTTITSNPDNSCGHMNTQQYMYVYMLMHYHKSSCTVPQPAADSQCFSLHMYSIYVKHSHSLYFLSFIFSLYRVNIYNPKSEI